jgi:hypothetical protein
MRISLTTLALLADLGDRAAKIAFDKTGCGVFPYAFRGNIKLGAAQ